MGVKKFWAILLVLMANSALLYAQPGEPCNGADPDAYCPLDTWVFVLAGAALVLAVLHLSRKQKSLLKNAEGIK